MCDRKPGVIVPPFPEPRRLYIKNNPSKATSLEGSYRHAFEARTDDTSIQQS